MPPQQNKTKQNKTKQNKKQVGWSDINFSFFQSKEMKELVLLDSNSTETVFATGFTLQTLQNLINNKF